MKKAVSRVYLALIYLFLYAPILLLVVFSFNDTDTKSRTVWSGFSLRWYEMLFQDRMLLQALTNTLNALSQSPSAQRCSAHWLPSASVP